MKHRVLVLTLAGLAAFGATVTHAQSLRLPQRLAQQLAQQQNGPKPTASELTSEALERLIRKKAILQFAAESGIRVSESDIDQAEQSVARQNQIDVAEMYKRLAAVDGISVSQFRKQLREQITLTRAGPASESEDQRAGSRHGGSGQGFAGQGSAHA